MNKPKRTAFIIGATGFIGLKLVIQLCESHSYDQVITLTRRELPYKHPKIISLIMNFDEISDDVLTGVDDVFCCIGTTIKKAGSKDKFKLVDYTYPVKIAQLAKNSNVSHFLLISAMWANPNAKSYYTKIKGELEETLTSLNLKKLSVLRPSLLIGERDEFRLGEKVSELIFKLISPLLQGSLKKMRPISGEVVANALEHIALYTNEYKLKIYESDELSQIG